MRFAWQGQGFRALRCRWLRPSTQNLWKGCKFHVTEVLLCSDHFAWQLQEFVCLGSTFAWQAQYFWSIHIKIVKKYWNSEVKCPVNFSFFNEVSQKRLVFDLQSFFFEGSLAQKLRFWASKLHFWRKSRTKASFSSFKASFLKEVSHKSFVFELQSFIFEGSLAQKLRFWASKLHFWRKSRTKASFSSFKASFLKEVSHKSFVFELQSFIFEGSLVDKLRFWALKFPFWRTSRRKASFLTFKAHFIAPCVFLLTTRNHGVRWVSPSYKSYSCQSRGQRKETCDDTACPTTGSRAHYFKKSGEVPQSMKRICLPLLFLVLTDASLLTVRSFPSQLSHIVTQPIERKKRDLLWGRKPNWSGPSLGEIASDVNRLTHQWIIKPFESRINWPPSHLNLRSVDNQIIWILNQLTK